jgi:hypothetical protein
MRPHVGLKTAWIKQKENIVYTDLETADAPAYDNIHIKQDTWGLGIRAGLNNVWHFARNWGIYGNAALSALWTSVESKRKDVASDINTPATTILNIKNGFHEVMPVLELGLGLTYMVWFSNENYMFKIDAGWEEQVWFNTNHFYNGWSGNNLFMFNSAHTGNLTFQGFTLNLEFAF